jgi:hypothetical protein
MQPVIRRALGLLALAGALGACQPAPVLAPAPPRRTPVVEQPRPKPEAKSHVARHRPVPADCGPTDETGLSAAQKDALFQQFEAWQASGGKPAPGGAHPDASAAPRVRGATTVACRGRAP